MSLKSIRESYSTLLNSFEKAGIKLDESQKGDLDVFIVGLESRIQQVKESTAKATKKIVEKNLNKEYKKVVESILSNMAKNQMIAGKIEKKVQSINESKKFARKLDSYLDLYVESVLPKKTIVDYDRMNKLEKVFESLKDTLLVNEDTIEAKKAELTESFKKSKSNYETQIAKLQAKLNESMKKEVAMHKKIEADKARNLLESKLADIPAFEARILRKRLAGASVAEIEKKFNVILESAKKQLKENEAKEEMTLEEEVSQILNTVKTVKPTKAKKCCEEETTDEDDLLKNRVHNGHKPVMNEDDEEKKSEDVEKVDEDDDEEPVELNESEKIPSFLMNSWIDRYSTIETKGY